MGFPSAWKQELINIARANNPNFKIEFMLDMFNKRNKDEIYDSQQRKIKAIIISEIIPFIKTKITIRETEKNPIETVCPKCGGKLVLRTSNIN